MRAFLILTACLLAAPAWAQTCNDLPPTQVNVVVRQDNPQLITSRGMRDLLGMAEGQIAGASREGGHVPLGIATARPGYSARFESSTLTFPSGQVCGRLSKVDIEIFLDETAIYIAREIPANSCVYREVLAHENRHVTVDYALLQEWKGRIQREIKQGTERIGYVNGVTASGVADEIKRQLQPVFERSVNAMLVERITRQGWVDTPQEYERVSRACNGESQKYVRQAFGR